MKMDSPSVSTPEDPPGKITLNVSTDIDVRELARWMGHQLLDEDALTFLKILDDQMASVDFTDKAVTLFGAASVAEYVNDAPHRSPHTSAMVNVTEFIRQADLMPAVQHDGTITTCWTDPTRQAITLNNHDLKTLVDLASIGLAAVRKGKVYTDGPS